MVKVVERKKKQKKNVLNMELEVEEANFIIYLYGHIWRLAEDIIREFAKKL